MGLLAESRLRPGMGQRFQRARLLNEAVPLAKSVVFAS
jgi:hypothetical protein